MGTLPICMQIALLQEGESHFNLRNPASPEEDVPQKNDSFGV